MIVIGVGLISMILPPYVPASSMVPANLPDEESQVLLVEEGFLMKTSPLTEAGDQTLYAKGFYYTVEDNDNITSIAKLHNIAVDTIRWANNLQPNSTLKPGQKLWILPVDGVVHRVQRGQNLTKIADLYGIDADKIRKQNKLEGSYLIAGQELIIPGGKPIPPSAPATAIAVKPPSNNPAVTRTLPEKPLSVRRQLYEGAQIAFR
jgi:LysM repeat protein